MPSKFDNHYKYIFPCDCGDYHSIEVEWDDADADWRFLSIADMYRARRLRDRIKAAFTVLRGKLHYHSGVLLTEEAVNGLRTVLDRHQPRKIPVEEREHAVTQLVNVLKKS